MNNYIFCRVVLSFFCTLLSIFTVTGFRKLDNTESIQEEIVDISSRDNIESIVVVQEQTLNETKPQDEVEQCDIVEELLPKEDIDLIALVTMAEAEGECEEGKRLVIDTILNRVDSPHFPDTVHAVIYQKNQFSSMWNGRANRCWVQDDICQLVKEELLNRSNTDVIFFRAGRYGKFGTPLFRVGNHYFSSYK